MIIYSIEVAGRDQQPYQLLVRCSDSNVLCDSKPVQPGEPHNISIKVSKSVELFSLYFDCSKSVQLFPLYFGKF